MHFKFPFIYFSILCVVWLVVVLVTHRNALRTLLLGCCFSVCVCFFFGFPDGIWDHHRMFAKFVACCKNCGFLLFQDNFSKLVYIRYHSYIRRRMHNTFTYKSFTPIYQLWSFGFFPFIFLVQIVYCSRCVFLQVCGIIFAGSTNWANITLALILYYYHYFLLGTFYPESSTHTHTKCWFCVYITVSNSQLFSMDVSSDLHANDRKHDVQPSSKQTFTHHTLRWSWIVREKPARGAALSLMEIMFGQPERWKDREGERERVCKRLTKRGGWDVEPHEKSRRKNPPNPIPFS